jgi:predicted phosphodiesterase
MKIVVCGDIHGNFNQLNTFINKNRGIELILQCGDFGYWPKEPAYRLENIKNQNTKICWCDGNHEDFSELSRFDDVTEIVPNIFYMPRGSILELPDKRKVLFIGGALSIDRQWRILGHSYFNEETITQRDIMNLPDENIDIVVSHTAPNEFKVFDYHRDDFGFNDPSRDALSYVLNKYKPKLWFNGHMHTFKQGMYKDCIWTCLGAISMGQRWFIEMEC